jgi:dethiobiotin synthetase
LARPERLVLVTGTGTEVGKTWVGARWLAGLDIACAARKPVQSFERADGATDAEILARATGEPVDAVCAPHRWYEVAMAPPMAAAVLGRPPFTIGDLVDELRWPDDSVAIGLVEGVGGPRSPLAVDGDTVDLARAIEPDDVVLVADAGLGTINAVRLSAAALVPHPLTVFLNRFDGEDELHRRNRAWLVDDGFEVVTSVNAL